MRGHAFICLTSLLLTGCPLDSNDNEAATRILPAAKSGPQSQRIDVAPTDRIGSAARFVGTQGATPMTKPMAASTPLADTGRRVHNDANADGRSDIIWRHPTVDQVAHWVMDGPRIVAMTGLTASKSKASRKLSGDFDGDRRVDQLWFKHGPSNDMTSPGELTLAKRNDAGYLQEALTLWTGHGWEPMHAIDMNGDRKADIVWIDYAGNLVYWVMDGFRVASTKTYTYDGEGYHLYTAGDFDGDGRGDLIFITEDESHLYMWRGRADGNFDQLFVAGFDSRWDTVGVTDLNGDGRSDLIWQNYYTDEFAYWWMNGAAIQKTGVRTVGKVYIATTGDFDGDGKGDLIWMAGSKLYQWRSRGDGEFDGFNLGSYDANWFAME